MFRWLHISDIHYRFNNYETKIVRSKFIRKIKEKGKGYYKYLFISGDLLLKYENNGDFKYVEKFLDDLLDISGINKENIFLVPGNHDLKRDNDTDYDIDLITEDSIKCKWIFRGVILCRELKDIK
ncbi:metallophosphoesterase [Inconstantimicrobium porci]|uniref:metallophosphoesterase n=1 Tax=Inconstantimicrobium porci TaxID=2652291 RepID=UPI002409778A|nr:metallophosphoesterase [Inconstantimicrobium porci]MDD6770081.1 metallophosphoesterase [Inconstantimicrobium porci]